MASWLTKRLMYDHCEYCPYRFTQTSFPAYLTDLHAHMQQAHIHEADPVRRANRTLWGGVIVVVALVALTIHACGR